MDESQKDGMRAIAALHSIVDGRDPVADRAMIMFTLDHVVSATLLLVMEGDHEKAAGMLNEGLVLGVERRIAIHQNRMRRRAND
ncbi:MAG: hypothetical protein AAGI34_17510 [Pseudomonadota bacterium]